MFLVGLTGGIATGKSTVSKYLSELGCAIVDADLVARQVVEPGRPAWRKIIQHFGDDILHEDQTLNRDKMAQIIFNDASKRRLLNSITHPEIYKSIVWSVIRLFLTGHQFVVLDLPLLFESGAMAPYMSEILVVYCKPDLQLQRLTERNSYSHEEAMQRINAQVPLTDKCQKATYVIDNSGSIEETKKQIQEIFEKLKSSKKHWKIRAAVLLSLVTFVGTLSYGFYAVWNYLLQ